MLEIITSSVEATEQLAGRLALSLPDDTVVALFGDLAAGKTTFIRGMAAGLGIGAEQVSSPTFVYLNIYEGTRTLYHFDLYRLADSDEFLAMGFDEFFHNGGITCIEWSERIAPLFEGQQVLKLTMEHVGEGRRRLCFEGPWPEVVS